MITTAGTCHADRHTFRIKSRSVLLRMTNVSDGIFKENQNKNFAFSNIFFGGGGGGNRAVYEIMWTNIIEPQTTIWRMDIAC